jgi:hypothetical protein
VSGHPSPKTSTSLPRPLLWAIAVCLFALAAIAIIAVARLAGFNPEQLISLVRGAESLIGSTRGRG